MPKKQKPSPVYRLLSLVWNNTNKATGDSWERLNQSMCGAMNLAIDAGFPFAPDDFNRAMADFDGGRWFDGEGYYTLAVQTGNLSACQAIEVWKKRPSFIADDVSTGKNCSYAHLVSTRKRGRLALGSQFPWRGHQVKVTSFARDGSHLTACSYHARKANDYSNKVAKRYKITVAGIHEERERKRLYDRLNRALDAASPATKQRLGIKDDCGVRRWAEFSGAPKKALATIKELEKEAND
ncbi:hypothetical protein LCGC14_1291420 [marine sediment metagenome]|uniref:Uncharacterized protein n=1 Tax=marine sediment metagenome TaxID=412755 RepID=A0A0F9KTY9_9ZZZZ